MADRHWQLSRDAARRYEDVLVASILGPFAAALVDHASIAPARRVLDVGCGTGAATLRAALRAGTGGRVVGLDLNPGMLAVARAQRLPERAAPIEWMEADATRIPLGDASVDLVLCAQVLQFVPRAGAALADMARVLVPGGRLALSVWCPLEKNPYFHALVDAVSRHLGAGTSAGLAAAFALGDAEKLANLLSSAGFSDVRVEMVERSLRLPPMREFVGRHVAATPMAEAYAGASEAARATVVADVVRKIGDPEVPFRSLFAMARH